MIIDIIAILVLIAFSIVGLCMHFNKTARRIYSLITGMAVAAILLKVLFEYLPDWNWYQRLAVVFSGVDVLNVISYWFLLIFGSILLSFVFNLLYKLIDLGVASISKGTARVCGLSFGLLNAAALVMVVLQVLGMCDVEVSSNIFHQLTNLISIR